MQPSIELTSVRLDYPVYSVRAKSLRNAVFKMAVGGRLYAGNDDVVIIRALSDVSLKIREGDRLGLVGHNGSGKTSLLRVLAGIYAPTAGAVDIRGKITSSIALGAGLDMDASGLENIEKMGLMRMIPHSTIKARRDAIVEFSGLGDFIRLPVNTYSAGMLARLTFAVATEFDADILVLDEWLGAGDADFMTKAQNRMLEFVAKAKIVVLATHNYGLVENVCNKVCVLDAGRISFFGTTEEWLRRLRGETEPPAPVLEPALAS